MFGHESDASPSGWRQYVRQHMGAVVLCTIFVLVGAAVGPLLFPDLATWRAVSGGTLFGGFCALCAAAGRFF